MYNPEEQRLEAGYFLNDQRREDYSHQTLQAIIRQISVQSFRSLDRKAKDRKLLDDIKTFHRQMKNDVKKFAQRVQECNQHVARKMQEKFEILNTTSKYLEQNLVTSNFELQALQESILDVKEKLENEENWVSITENLLTHESSQEEQETKTRQDQSKVCQKFNNVVDILENALQNRLERIFKVEQFINNMKKVDSAPIRVRRQSQKASKLADGNKPDVEFLPENLELIFNLWTFERQPIQFVLQYDEDHKKFSLKNPKKDFHLTDFQAVRAFNFHKSIPQLYEELSMLICKYIDDADMVPPQIHS